MVLPLAEVTAETWCPASLGGLAHYPVIRHGRPVTMPDPDAGPYRPGWVLLSWCAHAYLLPPVAVTDTALAACPCCEYGHAACLGETVEVGLRAG